MMDIGGYEYHDERIEGRIGVGDGVPDPKGFDTQDAIAFAKECLVGPEEVRLFYNAEKAGLERKAVLSKLRPTARKSRHFVE